MRKRHAFVALVAAATLPLIGAAEAKPSDRTEARVLSHVTIDNDNPTVAYVRAKYTCQPPRAGDPDQTHLWVSVKQNADATADPALTTEGSGFGQLGGITVWSQSHPTNEVICDGKNHVQLFEVNRNEFGYGALQRGEGYVQFCLFGGDGTFVFDMNFQKVK